jgi:hypothetical protein
MFMLYNTETLKMYGVISGCHLLVEREAVAVVSLTGILFVHRFLYRSPAWQFLYYNNLFLKTIQSELTFIFFMFKNKLLLYVHHGVLLMKFKCC